MSNIEADLVRMLYELTEVLWHQLPDNSFGRKRLEKVREHIRETYDESVYG